MGPVDLFGHMKFGFLPNIDWVGLLPVFVVLGGVALVVVAVVYSMFFIAKGGGQFGIIEGYVGTIGAGKTTLAVQHALKLAVSRNAVLLSNIPVRCGKHCGGSGYLNVVPVCGPKCRMVVDADGTWTYPDHPMMLYHSAVHCVIEHRTLPMNDDGIDLTRLTVEAFALRDAKRGLVLLMDEVGVIMPARLWKDFSVALMWVLQQ